MPRKPLDLAGEQFGSLTVIDEADRGPQDQTRWRCRCACGAETIVTTGNLRSGNTKSCGCLRGRSRQVMVLPDWMG